MKVSTRPPKLFRASPASPAVFTLLLLLPVAAHAQAAGSPFDTGFTAMQNLFTGTIAKVASLIAIVIGGYGFAHGEPGAKKTSVLEVIRQGAEAHGFAVEGFAPTSRAAQQLRDSGISAGTLQGFLAQGGRDAFAGDPTRKHLYMLDESSLASTRQMRDFIERLGPHDKVLLVGDTRQHLGVDAGKPFEQLQQAGMHTAQLDQIIRQRDPELLKAVDHLSRHETAVRIAILHQHGRITQIAEPQLRFEAIAKSYASQPENTLIVSPDNASRREINEAVRQELKAHGIVAGADHQFKVLVLRSELTGADRKWASQYGLGDVLRYQRGSKAFELARGSYAEVVAIDAKSNSITVQRDIGGVVSYDPSRVRGIDAYREIEKSFAIGDRLQMNQYGYRDAFESNQCAIRLCFNFERIS